MMQFERYLVHRGRILKRRISVNKYLRNQKKYLQGGVFRIDLDRLADWRLAIGCVAKFPSSKVALRY